jgi:CubicO group peptidase (beta-lactamase class C family)
MGSETQEVWERLRTLVSDKMKKTGVPGVVVGILHDGEIRAAGFGVTNVDHPLDVTEQTLFQIGSITKTFTGTAIMRLVEMGKIDLDATVRTYVPDFKVGDETASTQATIRHLLIHTGGWVGDFFRDTGPGADALPKYVAEMADLEQLAPLGAVWSYNNAGFCLAGYVIERVTGQSYEAALHDLVLEPLGLENTFLNPADVMVHCFVAGHNVGDGGAQVAQPWSLPRSAWPAGGIICTVHDLLRYAGFHMGDGTLEDGTQLLRSDSLSQMQTPHVTVWKDEQWGLTWSLDRLGQTRSIGHGGGTTGQVSLLTLVPVHKFAVAVFTNANSGGSVTSDVTKWALKAYLGLEKPDPKPIQASEQELAAFVGRYERPMVDLELGMLSGRLIGQMVYKGGFPSQDSPPPPPPPPATLALCETDRLIVLDGMMKDGTAEVIRKEDGSIGWLRAGGRLLKRLA